MSLFTVLRIGTIELANRTLRSATQEGAAELDVGRPTDAMAAFYARLAQGGVGLIVTGHVAVSREGRCNPTMSALYVENFVPAFAKMVEASHAAGVPMVCQLNHGGRQADPAGKGIRPLCPSAVKASNVDYTPEELSPEDIDRIIEDYGRAAGWCRQAGFDGVQIHSAHGFLVSQFNSPLTNRRTDRWGGTAQKRRSFAEAVYASMREQVGDGYPILVKQNVSDYHPDGLSEAEAIEICRMWEALGIAAIELSGGIGETIPEAFRAEQARKEEVVFFEREARAIREAVGCPLILTGGIRRRTTAERLLAEGVCDAVGLCRPMIREPDLPAKWRRGEKDSADCVSCGGCKASAERCNYCALLKAQDSNGD